jgi:hypothetical protein
METYSPEWAESGRWDPPGDDADRPRSAEKPGKSDPPGDDADRPRSAEKPGKSDREGRLSR